MKRTKQGNNERKKDKTSKGKIQDKPQIEELTGKKIAEHEDQQLNLFDDSSETK
jgi:hypothetical protein